MVTNNVLIKETSRSSLICRICGDKARGMNFNVITCMSCKSFFRRNALRYAGKLRCARQFNCEITKEQRRGCAACRLKKCFVFGMKPQLIRSFNQQQLPTPQPLSLLRNDRSTLSFEQWNLISNIIHVCDERSFTNRMKSLLDEGSSLPIKMRAKPSLGLNCLQQCILSVESLINQSFHFHSLSFHALRAVVMQNTISIATLYSSLIIRDINLFNNSHFILSFNGTLGFDLLKRVSIFNERIDCNCTIIKIMMFVIAFSSNSSTVTFDSSQDIRTMATSIDLIHIQDIYVTLLWKYLVYQYGFEEAILRYTSLIKTILDLPFVVKEACETKIYEEVIDSTVKQMKNSLIIED